VLPSGLRLVHSPSAAHLAYLNQESRSTLQCRPLICGVNLRPVDPGAEGRGGGERSGKPGRLWLAALVRIAGGPFERETPIRLIEAARPTSW